jgi:hypothetical protein
MPRAASTGPAEIETAQVIYRLHFFRRSTCATKISGLSARLADMRQMAASTSMKRGAMAGVLRRRSVKNWLVWYSKRPFTLRRYSGHCIALCD